MKKWFVALGIALGMATVSAQSPIVIHGHPQKAVYASEAEWPTISSQCHWLPATSDGMVGHTHVDVTAPIYAELTGAPLRVPFTVKIFHTEGIVSVSLDRQELVTKIEWDDIGEAAYRELPGDPHGLQIHSGHITYDPRRNVGGHGFPDRGWYSPQFEVGTRFTSRVGVETLQLVRLPFYSMLDPTAPDGSLSGVPLLISSCYPHSPETPEWGTNYVETGAYIPLMPISTLWRLWMDTTSYGGRDLGDGAFDQRVDLDLHAGILGRTLSFQPEGGFNGADRAPVLDPAILGAGPHKMAFIWSKPRVHNEEIVSTLLVIDVVVDPNAPPPPLLCQDPKAKNVGQPQPCVYETPPPPPPPPPPQTLVWQSWGLGTWNVSFEREVDISTGTATGRMRACIGGQCIPIP